MHEILRMKEAEVRVETELRKRESDNLKQEQMNKIDKKRYENLVKEELLHYLKENKERYKYNSKVESRKRGNSK